MTKNKWLLLAVVIIGVVAALALGVRPWNILVVCFVLACPLSMYFMMGAMGKSGGHAGMDQRSDRSDSVSKTEEQNARPRRPSDDRD